MLRAALALIVIVAFFGTALFAFALMSDGCGVQIVQRHASPAGTWEAVLLQRDCGATTSFTTQIAVQRPKEMPESGNVFVADDGRGAARTGPWGGPWAEVSWLSDSRLSVRYAEGARVFLMASKVRAVDVIFEQVP